jgi:hypothetical protein
MVNIIVKKGMSDAAAVVVQNAAPLTRRDVESQRRAIHQAISADPRSVDAIQEMAKDVRKEARCGKGKVFSGHSFDK